VLSRFPLRRDPAFARREAALLERCCHFRILEVERTDEASGSRCVGVWFDLDLVPEQAL
jgi:hypothetical protein